MTDLAASPPAAWVPIRSGQIRWVPALLVAHAGLGLLARESAVIATAAALAALLAAGVLVLQTGRLVVVAQAAGYIASSQVLWRMTGARVFWQTAEYALLVVLGVALIRFFPRWRRVALPVGYLAAFLPAVVLALLDLNLGLARNLISFNLAGPIALAVSVLFFSQVRSDLDGFRAVLWAMLLPVVSVATIALANTVMAEKIAFSFESNFTTSGGFGPNQVSAVLGMGALLALLLALTERAPRLVVVELSLAVWFLGHAILTFSRGGVLNVALAVVLGLVAGAGRLRSTGRFALIAIAFLGVAAFVVFPRLDRFTGGNLGVRYGERSTTERNLIATGDLGLFRGNAVAGVGLGVASAEGRTAAGEVVAGDQRLAAHTEYTRLIAEQGLFGLAALLTLVVLAVDAFRRAQPGLPRVFVAAFLGWSLTEMGHSAMRLSLVGFTLALAVAAAELTERPQRVPVGSG